MAAWQVEVNGIRFTHVDKWICAEGFNHYRVEERVSGRWINCGSLGLTRAAGDLLMLQLELGRRALENSEK